MSIDAVSAVHAEEVQLAERIADRNRIDERQAELQQQERLLQHDMERLRAEEEQRDDHHQAATLSLAESDKVL